MGANNNSGSPRDLNRERAGLVAGNHELYIAHNLALPRKL
jgi:hypothetical protein